MTTTKLRSSPLLMLFALAAGAIFGMRFPSEAKHLAIVGTLFSNALRMTIYPLVFLTVTVGVYRLSDHSEKMTRMFSLTTLCTGSDCLDTGLQLRRPLSWWLPDGLHGVRYCHIVDGRASEIIEHKESYVMRQGDQTSNARSRPPTPRRLACVRPASLARSCCSGSA
jgi:Sodium:dicarboxylate symporter family